MDAKRTYRVLPETIEDTSGLISLIKEYCLYKHDQKIYLDSLNGKRIVVGGPQSDSFLDGLETTENHYKTFISEAIELCKELREKNGYINENWSVHQVKNDRQETGKKHLFIYFAPAYGDTYAANEEILTFLLLNFGGNAQDIISKEKYCSSCDAAYLEVVEEVMNTLNSSIRTAERWFPKQ
ncbi:MAG: hypothetical protein KAJ24_07855 [Candidatus Aenigmarchaeota archaeon]|nr:hypothetical protein [Candidatus Aenigmarchaeota archaeon]